MEVWVVSSYHKDNFDLHFSKEDACTSVDEVFSSKAKAIAYITEMCDDIYRDPKCDVNSPYIYCAYSPNGEWYFVAYRLPVR